MGIIIELTIHSVWTASLCQGRQSHHYQCSMTAWTLLEPAYFTLNGVIRDYTTSPCHETECGTSTGIGSSEVEITCVIVNHNTELKKERMVITIVWLIYQGPLGYMPRLDGWIRLNLGPLQLLVSTVQTQAACHWLVLSIWCNSELIWQSCGCVWLCFELEEDDCCCTKDLHLEGVSPWLYCNQTSNALPNKLRTATTLQHRSELCCLCLH